MIDKHAFGFGTIFSEASEHRRKTMTRKKKMSVWTRRDFLKSAGITAVGVASAGPIIVPSRLLGAYAPSNRITVGCIGVGGMGTANLRVFMSNPTSQVVAVCDVDAAHRENARQVAEIDQSSSYNDYRDLLARDDIDAVVVSTPDHWHVPISAAAVKAGKDVYCEKPLTLTVAGGRILSDAVKRYGRILQTGSQQRSDSRFRFACELVRNGRIGDLHTIRVEIPGNNRENPQTWPVQPVPNGFDYDMWLGPAPWQPYTELRCHYTFRFILDYSGGQITNWGAHYLDIAQWGHGSDATGPVEIMGQGEFPKSGLFDTALRYYVEYTYADGVKVILKTAGQGVRFEGSEGWLFVNRQRLDAQPRSIVESAIGPGEIHLYESKNHQQNFLDSVRLRNDPVAPAEIGHRSASLCHLGNIAMMVGGNLFWDPEKERFVNDSVANALLSRSTRTPWSL